MCDKIRRRRFFPVAALFVVVFGSSLYANLSHFVIDPDHYAYFPPFLQGSDRNLVGHLGAEYFNIARSLAEGQGFSSPFGGRTGPTSWMPPILPLLLAGMLLVCGSKTAVVVCIVILQNLTLVLSGWVVLDVVRRTSRWASGGAWAVMMYIIIMYSNCYYCFQFTHDIWLNLLIIDLIVILVIRLRGRPLGRGAILLWGGLGGAATLANPILGLVWTVASMDVALLSRRLQPLAWSVLVAVLCVFPWLARNYLVFGRVIPIKSNAAFELYQANCIESDGVLRVATSRLHPYNSDVERSAYREQGEMIYISSLNNRFSDYLRQNPWDFLRKVGNRLLAATVLYVPYEGRELFWGFYGKCILHPIAAVSIILIISSGTLNRKNPKLIIISIYLIYISPYVMVSYYDRYAAPLMGLQGLLCFWGFEELRMFRNYRTEPRVSIDHPGSTAAAGGEPRRLT